MPRARKPRSPTTVPAADPAVTTQEVLTWLKAPSTNITTLQDPFPHGDPNARAAAFVLGATASRQTLLSSEETLLLP